MEFPEQVSKMPSKQKRNPDYVAQRIGHKPTLGVEFERELHDYAVTMSGLYYGITKAEVCRLA